ncbi:enoyl-CoA hydratase-related protein [Actinacidiphila sp. ITFR-21]|uniref:enoyl-CoA hydratase-related protein n=1 Tax=Actinacidiphila sp. ITFR-21 TaxID=3075199 RepID=UPI00288988F3|nr:enoyl-CoA hydratase-related protein [Streptomyces sp. ITFR-21]WNI18998.1 enoyl-CoA hydratase-related protein [Streptomyces sp. ITFR-21]
MAETVVYRRDGRIGLIGLNRPEKLNAINGQLIADYHAALDEFTRDEEARVGILYGEGRAFCVGMDLSPDGGYVRADAAEDRTHIEELAKGWLRLWDCPKPIIAQVHGYCFAGGTQLPVCCDVVAVAEETRLGWPKMPVGAGWISPMWSFLVGTQRAKLMSYQVGSTITGREAYEWGYAGLVFPQDRLAEEVRKIAENMAKLPSDMLRIKKYANNRVLEGQGFRTAVLAGAEWDAVAHTTRTVADARGWIKEHTLKGAIAKFAREGM